MKKDPKINHFLTISLILFLAFITTGGVYYFRTHSSNQNSKLASVPTEMPVSGSPLLPGSSGVIPIKIFFGNNKLDKEGDCSRVYPVVREIPQTQAVAKAALNELFAGPNQEEASVGATSFFSNKTKSILKSVKIENETAYVDLIDIRQILSNVSTSCGSASFLAEIENTLKQFATVKKVIIAINGNPETFYEWIQIGCPPEGDFCSPEPFR